MSDLALPLSGTHVDLRDFAVKPTRIARRDIQSIAAARNYSSDWTWAFDNYMPIILDVAREYSLRRHLEIGGGRKPLFTPEQMEALGFDITVNDISARELDFAPQGYSKVVCDIASQEAPTILGEGRYDLAYCQMVMEHVADVRQMWRNIHAVLAPGGVAISFFPTLYAPPFVINNLIPENLSRRLLEFFFPHRKEDGLYPKFPALYDCCFSNEDKIVPVLKGIGFSQVTVLPFWGYNYFSKIPVLKQIDAAFTRIARARDWRIVSSFAFVIATK
ncbi:MAG TPA: class I SAM-dependent methyltransferase [Pseudolabrys sp.]|nr:class I SAM-dependent methyltransferase [Pseudolabrys sp.]